MNKTTAVKVVKFLSTDYGPLDNEKNGKVEVEDRPSFLPFN